MPRSRAAASWSHRGERGLRSRRSSSAGGPSPPESAACTPRSRSADRPSRKQPHGAPRSARAPCTMHPTSRPPGRLREVAASRAIRGRWIPRRSSRAKRRTCPSSRARASPHAQTRWWPEAISRAEAGSVCGGDRIAGAEKKERSQRQRGVREPRKNARAKKKRRGRAFSASFGSGCAGAGAKPIHTGRGLPIGESDVGSQYSNRPI